MIEGKAWGVTEVILAEPLIEIHRLRIVPGGYCSMHHHDYKWNAFVVLAGELTIEIKKKAYTLIDQTVLRAGQSTTVSPDESHRFMNRGTVPVDALEVYYPQALRRDDIVREDHGGVETPAVASPATDLMSLTIEHHHV